MESLLKQLHCLCSNWEEVLLFHLYILSHSSNDVYETSISVIREPQKH